MTIISNIPLKGLKVLMSRNTAAPGDLVLTAQDEVPYVGMWAIFDSPGYPTAGFVPFEGPNLAIFANANSQIDGPAILMDSLVLITIEKPDPTRAATRPIRRGDVCYISGQVSPCLSISDPAVTGETNDYLVLDGTQKGQILVRQRPISRIGTIGLDLVMPNPSYESEASSSPPS